MAVAVDATGTKKYQSSNTSFSNGTVITVGSGNVLLVPISFGYGASAPTSITGTWNGVSLTLLSSVIRGGGSASSYIFGLRSPAAGANTLAFSWTNSAEIFIDAVSFTGADVTSDATAFPVGGRVSQDVNISPTISVTSATGNYVIAAMSPGTSGETLTGTTLFNDSTSGTFINAAANYDVGASTVIIGLTSIHTNVSIAAANIAAAAGGASRGLFFNTPLSGLGAGGSFFPDRLS